MEYGWGINASGVFIVKVDSVFVINRSVSCISKLTATDEYLVEVRYNINRICWCMYGRARFVVCLAVAVPAVGSMNVSV